MTTTRAEFLRVLPADVLAASRVEGSRVHGSFEERRWEFVLSDRPERAIGTLRLAVIEVEIRLWGYTIEERHAFVAHLERHFQRAGG